MSQDPGSRSILPGQASLPAGLWAVSVRNPGILRLPTARLRGGMNQAPAGGTSSGFGLHTAHQVWPAVLAPLRSSSDLSGKALRPPPLPPAPGPQEILGSASPHLAACALLAAMARHKPEATRQS